MVSIEVHVLLAVRHFDLGAVAGQLLPCLRWRAFVVDWELHYANGCAEAAAMGTLEYAEHSS